METKIINHKGIFDTWNKADLLAMAQAGGNTNVGEKLVFDNGKIKTWAIHLPAGGKLPFHKHCRPYFWTALSAGKSRSNYHDGTIMETTYEINDYKYFDNLSDDNFIIHNLENIGASTLIFTTVEFYKL